MMAASMGPNFTGHPTAMGHPGVPGHPMGPGMPPNPGQQGVPGGGMGHQFPGAHMPVSGPGGQVNPAMMAGLPPNANPAHLQHMSQAQQQMFQQQQQQQHMQNPYPNPIAAMRQQQQLVQQHQQRQALLAQQAAQAGIPQGMNMPMGMPLNQQQLHQLRQAGMGPVHGNQAVMMRQLAMQQQAQQAAQQQAQQAAQQQAQQQQSGHAQQMAAAHGQGQPMPMGQQGMPNMPQPNQMAAQNPMGAQQGQPQGQPQLQPQPQPQPQQPGQQPQQIPQQPSQAGTPAPTGQQTPGPTPTPAPAQPNQMPHAQNQPHPQANQIQMPQQMGAAAAAQQLALQNSLLHQRREGMKGNCLLKLIQFSEYLSSYPGKDAFNSRDDLSYWHVFVNRFFSPNANFRHTLHVTDVNKETTNKQYDIGYPIIARYFHTHFSSGVKSMQLIMDQKIVDKPLPNEGHCIENQKASLVYWYDAGSHVVSTGVLRVQFDNEQRIELFEFVTIGHEEFVARNRVIEAAKPAHIWFKEWHKTNSPDTKQSPEMSKKGKKTLKSPQSHPPEVLSDLPQSTIGSEGVTAEVHQMLEIVEVMSNLNPLVSYSMQVPLQGPYQSMEQYVSNLVPQGMNGQPMQQGPRTPSMAQFPMGASPAAVHMNLPGSPHIGSPAPGQLQAPGMQMQASQQGTSSSGPSANTSPASNKRRRPSGVKIEDDGSGAPTPVPGPQMNGMGNRGQKPPTPRITKRVKGNPA